jgi:hypothetical protein
MSDSVFVGEYFATPQPPAADLPHVLTALDAELLGQVAQLTESALAIWDLPAPFDDQDQFDNTREAAPVSAWALPLNQHEILSFSLLVQQAVFGSPLMFVDTRTPTELLARLAVSQGHRLDSGAWVVPGFQDLSALPELLESCGWALIPVGAERSQVLFVTAPRRQTWVDELSAWCGHRGRNHGVFVPLEQGLRLAVQPAPTVHREKALDQHVDAFLTRLEIYFGEVKPGIAARVDRRLETRHQLRNEIALARKKHPLT